MTPAPDPLAEVRRYLVNYGGGYLRNTMWGSSVTCDYCVGIPSDPMYPMCYKCQNLYRHNRETSDRRGFVSYGWDNHQSATTMYRYKELRPPPGTVQLVRALLFYAIHRHFACTADELFVHPDSWAAVPSLRNRGYPQALRSIGSQLVPVTEARMAASPDARDPRTFRPENFVVNSNIRDQHVLLIDDTWTSGAHAESAAAALKRAGASYVTLLVLARWLQPDRGVTKEFIHSELTSDFDPDKCPFSSGCRT